MVLSKVRVPDYDQFWSLYTTRGAEHRRKFGSTGSRVFRNEEDTNEVWLLFDWSKEDFRRFLDDAEAQEIMDSAGLQKRESVFLDSVGEFDS